MLSMKKGHRISGGLQWKRLGVPLCVVFLFFTSVVISSQNGMEEKKSGTWELLSYFVRKTYPVIEVSAMNSYDRTISSNWIMALFSEVFFLNQYASHNAQAAVYAENQNAAEVMNQEGSSVLLDHSSAKNKLYMGEVGFISGDFYFEDGRTAEVNKEAAAQLKKNSQIIDKLKQEMTCDYLIKNFYIVNSSTTTVDKDVFNVEKLLKWDCTMKKESGKPQILIYHTHGASEHFRDSRKGKTEDSIIGVGGRLADILQDEYGYEVIHDETPYDLIDGKIDRNHAYDEALGALEQTLKEHPTIEVMIDLHRDASRNNEKRATTIDGKPTAQVMLFNGLSRNLNGEITYLKNPNLQGNLAFSLQMKLASMELYPDFATRIFLKGYRYNLHLREKSLLIELGNDANTVEEAMNAMEPLARMLDQVLKGQ